MNDSHAPWSPNRHVRSRVMPARDADGYLRILEPKGLPLRKRHAEAALTTGARQSS